MTVPVDARVHRVPAVPDDLPVLIVSPADGAPAAAEAFRAPAGGQAPPNNPLLLRVRLATVNSPDVVELRSATRNGMAFAFDVEHRVFEGILGANVQETAVLEADTGRLAAGRYTVTVDVDVLGFDQPGHPEEATARTRRTITETFEVV